MSKESFEQMLDLFAEAACGTIQPEHYMVENVFLRYLEVKVDGPGAVFGFIRSNNMELDASTRYTCDDSDEPRFLLTSISVQGVMRPMIINLKKTSDENGDDIQKVSSIYIA